MSYETEIPQPGAAEAASSVQKLFWAGAILTFGLSLVVYVKTMAASSSFWDAGEFIASAHTLGIPHSPGTPLYVLAAKAFSLIPLGFMGVAERINLLSAVCGAAGILFVYMLIVRFLDFTMGKSEGVNDGIIKVAAGVCGALFLAFSDTYWNNAIEAEVYAMSNALMGFMTWLVLRWGENPLEKRSTFLIYLLFYLLALTVGFHLGTILVFSGIFFYILMTKQRTFSTLEFWIACIGVGIFVADATLYRNGQLTLGFLVVYLVVLLWIYSTRSPFAVICSGLFLIGISVHLYLLIRSGHNPAIDEGNPETWRDLYAVLRREQYPPTNVLARKATFGFQLQHFNGYFQAQYQMASAYISQLNLGSLLPVGLGIWGMVEQFTKHRKTFVLLFVTLLVTSLGLIIFLNFSDAEVRERDYFYSPAFYYFAIYIGIGVGSLVGEVRNLAARGQAGTSPLVAGLAIVLCALPLFTLKHHYFTHDRSNNYTCPVYARNMLVGLEKDSIIFTNGDNDTFPLWYIQEVERYRTDIRVVNLSLLNTPWYIKQLRDNEPTVPITWDDETVDRLTPVPTKDRWLLVRDLAVQHILQNNKFQRPVYFAVTIPPNTYAPYREYLEMEGLAYKVVPRKGENMINVTRLERNITENYKYDGILTADWERDHSLYLPPHTEHLIQNYAAAFIQLAYVSHQDSAYDKALHYMKVASEISPHMAPPLYLLGVYMFDAGDTVAAENYYIDKLEAEPGHPQFMYRLAGIYERLGRWEHALNLIDALINNNPEDRDLVITGFTLALRGGLPDRARGYVTNWLIRHPDDTVMQQTLADIQRQLGGASGGGQ